MKTRIAYIASALLLAAAAPGYAGEDIDHKQHAALEQSGGIKPAAELEAAALALHKGGRVGESEVERKGDKYVYKAELSDADGQKWEVALDAASGEVLSDRKDD